jgi:hypothetical protein
VNKAKKHRYDAIWWSIELPGGWSVRDDPKCATLTSVKLKGVLQVSAYRKDSDIGEGELFELADEQPTPEHVEIGQFAALANTHDTEGLRWKKWWLTRDRILIFVTYNGPLRSADSEIQAAEELLKTLEVRP